MDFCMIGLFIFLGIWFLLSIVNQLGPRKRLGRLRRADIFQLLPMWNFFAPNPGVHDFYLLYRDKTVAGEIGNWQLAQPTSIRGTFSFLWNPGKVERKVLSDAIQLFAGYDSPGASENAAVMLTLPYLLCLKMVTEAPPIDSTTLRQFVLAQKKGFAGTDEILPILISDFHSM